MHGNRIFITGGAGFIGSRLVKRLVDGGSEVLAFDNLLPQVHGPAPQLALAAPLVRGDVRDRDALDRALRDFQPTMVVHLAAETGTGQSADEPARYAEVNVLGTARLIEAMRACVAPPRRVVLAATRAVYGEGAYRDAAGRVTVPHPRRNEDMARGIFNLLDENGKPLTPLATPEHVPLMPGSVYGSTKLMQEYLLQQSPAPWQNVILRLQNVYGPGQSLRNPYTGVLSIFCQQALAGKTLNIFEDGDIGRDFVFVDDVVAAFAAACECDAACGRIVNIGTGERAAIVDVARTILARLGLREDRLRVSGDFRSGDVRHAVADISLARELLGWEPVVDLNQGIGALVAWASEEALSYVA